MKIENEYLSDDRWHQLQEALAFALTPAVLLSDETALGASYDAAARPLADLLIMPEGMREKVAGRLAA